MSEAIAESRRRAHAGADETRAASASLPTLAERFGAVRAASEALAAPLSEADCTAQSMPDASPVKWHLAHTTWFFETFVLERFAPQHRAFDPDYRVLFNSYYNSVGEQYPRPDRGLITRPGLGEILRYRAVTDESVRRLLTRSDETGALADLVELGLQHEQQHQELILTDLKHLLSHNPTHPIYRARPRDGWESVGVAQAAVTDPDWHAVDGGRFEVGAGPGGFAFDNERPRHAVELPSFELAARLVTNGEWLAFMEDGGYRRPELWLSDGWATSRAQQWQAPLYWQAGGAEAGPWRQFTLSGLEPVQAADPVCHVSFYEADAFATWAGGRLPTEFEWEAAAKATGTGRAVEGHFAESGRFQPVARVGGGSAGTAGPGAAAGAGGPVDLSGNVWEWTSSAYLPYPRYRPPAGALGEYNGKFMSGQMVLRGGSCATPRSHARVSYRNFFPPGARWQFSGLRLARDGS